MTLAQVELMYADCPVTVYPKTDTAKGSNGKERKFERPSSSSLREAKADFDTWDNAKNVFVDLSGFSFS